MADRGLALHVHHADDLFEFCWSFDERLRAIERKPEKERALRKKLFARVPEDKIPGRDFSEWKRCVETREAYQRAIEAFQEAKAVHQEVWKAHVKAEEAYWKAEEARGVYLIKYAPELEALHKELCPDCPWDSETKTIFTRQNENGEWY